MSELRLRIRWWWHCLLRFHRMVTIVNARGKWIGCDDCGVSNMVGAQHSLRVVRKEPKP